MIELNLLPKELRKKEKRPLPKIKVMPIVIGIAAALVSVHIVLIVIAFGNSLTYEQLKVKWQELQPMKGKTEVMFSEIADLDKRVTSIRKIAKPSIDWARMVGGLNQAMTPSVWLYEFKPIAGKGAQQDIAPGGAPLYLELSGYALGGNQQATASVAKFISSLKRTPEFFNYFDDVELEMINSREVSGEQVMLFKLQCGFKGAAQAEAKIDTKKAGKNSKKKSKNGI